MNIAIFILKAFILAAVEVACVFTLLWVAPRKPSPGSRRWPYVETLETEIHCLQSELNQWKSHAKDLYEEMQREYSFEQEANSPAMRVYEQAARDEATK